MLAGRCYLNESLPYKAVDQLMDQLSRYLRNLARQEATALMPADVLALARIFPVLGRVEAIAAAERRVLEVPDWLELRRRAFAALRELCARLAAQRPLVLYIDDLQWGDIDSAPLLAELSRAPDPPPLLLLCGLRTGDGQRPALADSLHQSAAQAGAVLELRELALRPLTLGESEALARHLLQDRGSSDEHLGHPAGLPQSRRGDPPGRRPRRLWLPCWPAPRAAIPFPAGAGALRAGDRRGLPAPRDWPAPRPCPISRRWSPPCSSGCRRTPARSSRWSRWRSIR